MQVPIEGNNIHDWESFHAVFSTVFGFPSFYGKNMNAWIDCMTYLDDPEAGMTAFHILAGETLTLFVDNAQSLKARCPEQFSALVECVGFINNERNVSALIKLAFDS